MGLKRGQGPMGVRDQAQAKPAILQSPQRLGYVVVQVKMLVLSPILVDLASDRFHVRSAAAHQLDDPSGISDEEGIFVQAVLGIQDGGGSGHGAVEGGGIDGN